MRPTLRITSLAGLLALASCFGKSHEKMWTSATGAGGDVPMVPAGTGPSGTPADEQFPSDLLQPYAGPPVDYYDNTFINYLQLKGKVKAVFNDDWVRNGVDQFEANIGLLGGVDFQTHFVAARVASSDYLLALDQLTKDVCGQAVANGTGPFTGLDTTQTATGIDQVYRAMLYRGPTASDLSDASTLLSDLVALGTTTQSAWSGLCEALIRHPDFLFTLPPSRATATGADKSHLLLVKVAQDLLARPPTAAEFAALDANGSIDQMVDQYLSGTEFRDYFFYNMQLRTESDGSTLADEPARLWTYVVTQHHPFQDLLDGEYSVDPSFNPLARDQVHGATGVLTMQGYLLHKQGLPHYNYSARVLQDFLGFVFEVPESVIQMRLGATAATTVDPTSICYGCHYLLTPLAYQRGRWDDQGNYSLTDANGQTIDDSDRGLAATYPFKGEGMEAFSSQAVRKEKFVHHTLDAVFGLLVGRPMRSQDDERVIYKELWDTEAGSQGDLSLAFKNVIDSPTYQGP